MASEWPVIVVVVPLLIDLVVALLVAGAAVRGWRYGGASLVISIAAVAGGLVAGLWVARLLSGSLSPVWHVLLGVACAIGGVLVGW